MTPNLVLPALARRIIYGLFALIGLAIGAVGVWYTSVSEPVPGWLVRVGAVDAFVVSAPLFLAVLNINRDSAAVLAADAIPVDEYTDLNAVTDDEPAAEPVDIDTPGSDRTPPAAA